VARRITLPLPEAPAVVTPANEVAQPSRYRRPTDVLRLIAGALLLACLLALAALLPRQLLGSGAGVPSWAEPGGEAGRLLVALVHVAGAAATAIVGVVVLRHRRFRLLATVAAGAALAMVVFFALDHLVGRTPPARLSANLDHRAWLASAALPSPAMFAGAAVANVCLGPWLTRSWRRVAWAFLVVMAAARLLSGTALPFQLVLALATGAVVGFGLLVAFGAADRRIGPVGVGAALRAAGLDVTTVVPAPAPGRGSRGFIALDSGRRPLFVKVLGRDERDADLLYRAYRYSRLRGVDDVRRPATLRQGVEHQALVSMVAERAGVRVPRVQQVLEGDDGSALLVMDLVDGRSLDAIPPEALSDDVLERLWEQVDRLHRAGVAHRSLRSANVMLDGAGEPWIVDFSFSELAATERQHALDVAELLASLAGLVGAERAVAGARAVLGASALAGAVPLLQPLALSAATRRAVRGREGLLARTRAAAAAASGEEPMELVRLQRVPPRTLLMIAAGAGAFYFLLPQLAQAGDAWGAFRTARFGWLALVIPMSLSTYVGAGISMLGSVPQRLAAGPTVLAQLASSFANRVTPAGLGGAALNIRYLEKAGVPPSAAVAGVGLNTVAGGVVHVLLLLVFFAWSGSEVTEAFSIPSSHLILLVLAMMALAFGLVLATSWGRRSVGAPLRRAVGAAATNLRTVARRPAKVAQLVGGSMVVTVSYIGALAGSVAAFSGGLSVAQTGTVYLGAAALAAAAPTPGNLGAVEAALVAGLTGMGMAAGPAVSTVLTYRLATYWLPILPGWLAWTLMQRRRYV
jgi:glycosyltransferase 2 family protein